LSLSIGNDDTLNDMKMRSINGFKRRVLNKWVGKKNWAGTKYKEF
jgi:hypothetical protein